METPLAPQVTARKSSAPRLVLGSAEWLRRDRRQAFLFSPPGFTQRQVWESLKPKKKPPRPSSEMDGEQSARRKHERPRTALMSCLFIFHTYSVQPRGGKAAPGSFDEHASALQTTAGVQKSSVSLNPSFRGSAKQIRFYLHKASFGKRALISTLPPTRAPGRGLCDQVGPPGL